MEPLQERLPSRASGPTCKSMTQRASNQRATRRPGTFQKPAHWTDTPPPAPEAAQPQQDPDGLSPTRYGDWVQKGIAIDF